jgi:hypothetical protein
MASVGAVVAVLPLILLFLQTSLLSRQNEILALQTDQFRSQLEVAAEPVVRVLPEVMVQGDVAKFDLKIENRGIAHIRDLKIYEDYFVSLTPPDGPTTLTRFGAVKAYPNTSIPELEGGGSKPFRLEFPCVYEQMKEYRLSQTANNPMIVVRLLIKYQRLKDGKEFKTSNAYLLSVSGKALFDYDERGISSP